MRVLIAGIPDLTKNYENALRLAGVETQVSLSPVSVSLFDALLLPGGGDVDPAFFGEENRGSLHIDPALDQAQFTLLDAFIRLNRPVLGICRGMQLLNVYFGGTIQQDLPTSALHAWNSEDRRHTVTCLPGSALYRLYGPSCLVNSAHHQGLGRTGSNLRITQTAPDGVAEAVEHMKKPVLGVQWHPERTGFSFRQPGLADGELLIHYFLTLS